MGSPSMNGRHLQFHRYAATQRRPAPRAPNAGGRGRFLWERRGEASRASRARAEAPPDLNPEPERIEPAAPVTAEETQP